MGETNDLLRAVAATAEVPDGTSVDFLEIDPVADGIFDDADALGFEVLDEPCHHWGTRAPCSRDPAVQDTDLLLDPMHLTTPAQEIRAAGFRRNLSQAYGIELSGGRNHDFDRPAPGPLPASRPPVLVDLGGAGAAARRDLPGHPPQPWTVV